VQQARGERQALLPAARKLPRELVRAIGEAESRSASSTRFATSSIEYIRPTKRRFSRIVRSSHSEKRCVMYPTWRLIDLDSRRMSNPRHVPSPLSGVSSPQSIRIDVVLPLPFGPRKAEDLAAAHGQREILHHVMTAEALVQSRARR
jgi:hypothetical protein